MMKCHYETLYGNFLQHSFVEANYTVNQKRTFNQGIDLPGFLKTEEAIALQIGSAPPQIYKRLYNLVTFCGAISSADSNKSRSN